MQVEHKRKIGVTLLVILLGILLYAYLNRPDVIAVVVKRADIGMVQNTVANARAGALMASRLRGAQGKGGPGTGGAGTY